MSKGSLFWGKAKGKLGDTVFSVVKGQQVNRAYNNQVANPRTNMQTDNRISFSQSVKFYRHAVANFFLFAFEDKRKVESDYNAYMRHNVALAGKVTRENYEIGEYPALGNYLLSKGSLPAMQMGAAANYNRVILAEVEQPSGGHTIGTLSLAFIAANPSLTDGDIVTLVHCVSSLQADGTLATGATAPKWSLQQFVLDTTNTQAVATALPEVSTSALTTDGYITIGDADSSVAAFAACVVSRRVKGSKLRVTTTPVNNNSVAAALLQGVVQKQALLSWGSRGEAILEGGLLQDE